MVRDLLHRPAAALRPTGHRATIRPRRLGPDGETALALNRVNNGGPL